MRRFRECVWALPTLHFFLLRAENDGFYAADNGFQPKENKHAIAIRRFPARASCRKPDSTR
jgi:hypothetical protein